MENLITLAPKIPTEAAAWKIQRKHGLTPKTAWFLTQRIREVMVEKSPEPMEGTIVRTRRTSVGSPATSTARAALGTRSTSARRRSSSR